MAWQCAFEKRSSFGRLRSPLGKTGLLLLVVYMFVCTGCGTSAYEKRLEDRSAKIAKKEALAKKYKDLAPPLVIPGTPVSISVVKTLGDPKPLCMNGKKPGTQEDMDPKRAEPWNFKLPVPTNITYEGMRDAEGGAKMPVYCYIGAQKAAGRRR